MIKRFASKCISKMRMDYQLNCVYPFSCGNCTTFGQHPELKKPGETPLGRKFTNLLSFSRMFICVARYSLLRKITYLKSNHHKTPQDITKTPRC